MRTARRKRGLNALTGALSIALAGEPDSVAPILILQGTADSIIPVDSSQLVADRYCERGAPAELRIHEGDSHDSVFTSHLAEIDEWISQRLAGSDADSCL